MADMFKLRAEEEQSQTTDSPDYAFTEQVASAVQVSRKMAAPLKSSSPGGNYSTDIDDVRAKLEYAKGLQQQFRQAVDKTIVAMGALQQKLDNVNSETDQKLADEIRILEECISEREGSAQPPDNSAVCPDTVSLPVFSQSFEDTDTNLKLLRDKFEIIFRTESVKSGPLTSLTKYRDISTGFGIRGIAHDAKRQRFVFRTTDVYNPLKLYDYSGNLVSVLGREYPELADSGYYRGQCVDSKRDAIVAASSGRALVLGLDGSFRGEIKVGGNLVAAGYSEELDVYAVSDWDENKVYIIDPTSLQVTTSFGSRGAGDQQFDGPFALCFGAVGASAQVYLIVGDFNNNCLKVFDIEGQHYKTLGRYGSGPGELRGPSAVAADAGGRLITCDLHNQRLASFLADDSGVQWQQLLTSDDLNFRAPAMICVDIAARMVAIGYSGFNVINIFRG